VAKKSFRAWRIRGASVATVPLTSHTKQDNHLVIHLTAADLAA
jgi:hypothetical protein